MGLSIKTTYQNLKGLGGLFGEDIILDFKVIQRDYNFSVVFRGIRENSGKFCRGEAHLKLHWLFTLIASHILNKSPFLNGDESGFRVAIALALFNNSGSVVFRCVCFIACENFFI